MHRSLQGWGEGEGGLRNLSGTGVTNGKHGHQKLSSKIILKDANKLLFLFSQAESSYLVPS